jgi:hypothetical protein
MEEGVVGGTVVGSTGAVVATQIGIFHNLFYFIFLIFISK